MQVVSSLAKSYSEELSTVHCPVKCPSNHNSTARYSLGISLGNENHSSSSKLHSFWCHPKLRVQSVEPKFISTEVSTLITMNLGEYRLADSLDLCV